MSDLKTRAPKLRVALSLRSPHVLGDAEVGMGGFHWCHSAHMCSFDAGSGNPELMPGCQGVSVFLNGHPEELLCYFDHCHLTAIFSRHFPRRH